MNAPFLAGFEPVFSATIPVILPGARQYTRALSMSRLAYDLENLLSPVFAALALLDVTYTGLFDINAVAFLISAALIFATVLPPAQEVLRQGAVWDEVSFGIRCYLKTPSLRGLLTHYLGVAGASAMTIVNTGTYVRESLDGSQSDVALALAAAGAGSMLAAIGLPKILDRVADRSVMLLGALLLAAGLGLISTGPSFSVFYPSGFWWDSAGH